MEYMLMIHASEARFAKMTKENSEAMMQAYGKYTNELFESVKAGDCAALESSQTATTVQIRDGKRLVKDGPFAETREQLGGYYTFDVASEEEALAWAAKIPDAETATLELRPVVSMGAPSGAAPTTDASKGQKEYILLIYEPEARWGKMSKEEIGKTLSGYKAFGDSVKASKQFVAGDRLDTVRKAKCVTLAAGKRVVKDGPFAETREQLGGYYRVFAKDLDEAVEMATRIPAAETGTIEIRPVMDTSKYA